MNAGRQRSDTVPELTPGLLDMPPGLGENAPGTELPFAPLIRRLADRLDETGIAWAVLRNAADLPDYTRYDVDLLVPPDQRGNFLAILEASAAETGWRIAGRIRKRHYLCLLLVRGSPATGLFFLPLDVFTALEFRGWRFLETAAVLRSRIRTPQGIWTLPAGAEAAITLLKELLPHGVLKENSRAAVQAQAASDPERFRAGLEWAAGPDLAGRLVEAVRRGEWSLAPADARELHRAVRRRTPHPWLGLAAAAAQNLAHLFRPALGFVVCLAGADGSGKTTLARGLVEQLYKRPFKACRYVHGNIGVLPRFRDIRAWCRRRAGRPEPAAVPEPPALKGMLTPLPAWKSALLASYYAVDLWLARGPLRRWRGQWTLVILDRSFYDYYYQLGHRRCPAWVFDLGAQLIPKPDLLLCIVGDPGRIHARKPELTEEEIRLEQDILRARAAMLPFARILDGTAGPEALVASAVREVLGRLLGAAPATLCSWRFGGRPWLAYPAGSRAERLRALALFPRSTIKRRLFHAGVKGLTILGLDTRWGSTRDADADLLSVGERELLLEELRRAGVTVAEWLLAWPARPERRRQYLVFRDAVTRRLGVVKIGAGGFNRRQFQNETEMLRRLAPESHPFSIPSVLFLRELTGERTVLALGGFPPRFAPLSAAQAVRWSAIVIGHLAARRLAHGDLGPGNMLADAGGRLFLFDWENAAEAAPAGVDEIGFWLALRQRSALRVPGAQAAALRRDFRNRPEPEILATLDFLRARDNLAAARVREAWK